MPKPPLSKAEIAIYVARMLDELIALSRPLQDDTLEYHLALSAYLVRCYCEDMPHAAGQSSASA